jgi:hypothetical protein
MIRKPAAVLWEYPSGVRQPQIAQPVPVGPNRIAFSSGYGVGTELLEIKTDDGLDDGILACIDARDGSRKWKQGRYGHGQILLVGETCSRRPRKTAKSSSWRRRRGAERTHPLPRFLRQYHPAAICF